MFPLKSILWTNVHIPQKIAQLPQNHNMAKAHVHFSNDYTIDTLLVGKGASEISHLPKVCQHASKVKQQDDTSKRYTYIYILYAH